MWSLVSHDVETSSNFAATWVLAHPLEGAVCHLMERFPKNGNQKLLDGHN